MRWSESIACGIYFVHGIHVFVSIFYDDALIQLINQMFKWHCDLHATDHSMEEVLVTVVLYNTDTVTAEII